MMKPAIPKPTAEYMAAKRAECKPKPPCDRCDKKGKETLREQAPFWMTQAALAYNVPNSVNQDDPKIKKIPALPEQQSYEYNGVSFDDSPVKYVNTMNGGDTPVAVPEPKPEEMGKYLAMGSFFGVKETDNDPKGEQLIGRYFLVEVTDRKGFTIKNPNSCYPGEKDSPCGDGCDDTCFAPCGSYILSFSGTETGVSDLYEGAQDFDWTPMDFWPSGSCHVGPKYELYQKIVHAQKRMFDGTNGDNAAEINQMALETSKEDGGAGFKDSNGHIVPGKQITVVGHSLGGAHAQLAAVQIAYQYKAKVRLITFESILAFTPESAMRLTGCGVEGMIVGPDGVVSETAEPTVLFPTEVGKITAQRWIEDDSPLTAAPLLLPAGACCPIPILNIFNPFNWCFGPHGAACIGTWKDKYRLVGCWPFNQNLGKGYLSRALVTSVSLKVRAPCGCCQKKSKVGPYPNDAFEFFISEKRSYVSKAAGRLWLIGNCLCEIARAGTNHQQPWLLWELYKGAYQNEDAPNYLLGGKVSQYVPQVHGPAPDSLPPA